MTEHPQVLILILNWNNYPDTSRCLDSISRLSYDNIQVAVVDNGSSDGSNDLIKENFPAVILIASEKNLGFAGGNNLGLRYAMEKGIRFVLLLNNDTEVVQGDFLEIMLNEMQAEGKVAAVGPLVYQEDGNPQQTILPYPSLGKTILNTLGLFKPDLTHKQTADSLSGCCVLVSTEAIAQAGLLDENFFFYAEETEWFYRMRQAGWRILYLPARSILHQGASSSKRLQSEKVYIDRRANVIYTLVKGGQSFQAILVGLLMLMLVLMRILLSQLRKDSDMYSPAMVGKMLKAFGVMWGKAAAWARNDKLLGQGLG